MSKKTKRERLERAYRQRLIIIIVSIIVVLSIGVAILFYVLNKNNQRGNIAEGSAKPADISQSVAQAKRAGQTRDDAQQAVATGNTTKATQIYDTAIQSESDVTQKIKLYINQSELLFNAGKYDEAFAAAKKGGELSNDKYLMADWLARIYEQHGDLKEAAQNYTLAGQWASSPTNVSGFDKGYYDGEAARITTIMQKAGQQ